MSVKNVTQSFLNAAKEGNTNAISSFVAFGVNINSVNRFGETALHIAIRYGNNRSADKLISLGASLGSNDRVKNKPIHTAATYGRPLPIESILKKNEELVFALNCRNETPLHLAVRNGHAECAELLLQHGASLNAKDCIGDTPVHTAVLYGQHECLQVLLEHGASIFVFNRAKRTPLEEAKESQLTECIELLDKYEFQGIFGEIGSLGVETIDEFRDMLSKGSYPCYWNRIYLAGQYNVGKTTLAKNIVGDIIPEVRQSTDGIWIYIGRAGMNIEDGAWILLPAGSSLNTAVQSMLISCQNVDTSLKEDQAEETVQDDTVFRNWDLREQVITHEPSNELSGNIMPIKKSTENINVLPANCGVIGTRLSGATEDSENQYQSDLAASPHYSIKPNSAVTKTDILNLVLKACKSGEYRTKIVPIDIWDFGGQRIYYMTHQLFISIRGTFVLMFKGTKDIHKTLSGLQCLPGHYGKKTTAVYLMHWVNSILTYCKTSKAGFPKILLVATYKDKVRKVENQRENLTVSIEKLFENHPGKAHLQIRPLIFINAKDNKDQEIEHLKKSLVEMAFSHPRWGEPMPTLCVPLELQLAERVKLGQKIIARIEIDSINNENPQMKLSQKQLITFLRLQHSLGKYLFFDEGHLKEYVVIDPPYLIEVLRSVVTEEEFWPKEEGLRMVFLSMKDKGLLFRRDLLKIWNQSEFKHILPYQDYMINLFIHLDIIIEPRSRILVSVDMPDKETYYIVPCMISQDQKKKRQKGDTAITMAYKFIDEIIPPAFLYRFLGAFVSMWDLKSIYTDSAVVSVDGTHELSLYVDAGRLVVSLQHPTGKQLIMPTIASTVQECLTRAIVGISQFYWSLCDSDESAQRGVLGNETVSDFCGSPEEESGKRKKIIPYNIEFGINCSSQLCFFDHKLVTEVHDYLWKCPNHNVQHNIKDLTKWFAEKSLHFARKEGGLTCDSNCPGLGQMEQEQSPSDQQLGRLATSLTLKSTKDIFLHFGLTMAKWDELERDYPYTSDLKFFALWDWKQSVTDPTNGKLVEKLKEVEIDSHKLCEVFREMEVTELQTDKLSIAPTDELLESLSSNIGKEIIQLGVELGIKGADLQKVVYKYNTKLMEQTREVLRMWKSFKQPVHVLAKAFYRIGKFGVFVNCFNRYN